MNETDTTLQRGDCFRLLAACFYEPDKELFIQEELGEKLSHLLEHLAPQCIDASKGLISSLVELDQEKLSIDHAALFVGPFQLLAAPYGSVYLEKHRTVMGESTIDVALYYQDAGLQVDVKEPPDHIAVELEFLHYLCHKEAIALSDNLVEVARQFRDKQRSFYFNALRPWARDFCEAVRGGTDNSFYLNTVLCLEGFLAACEQLYNEAPGLNVV